MASGWSAWIPGTKGGAQEGEEPSKKESGSGGDSGDERMLLEEEQKAEAAKKTQREVRAEVRTDRKSTSEVEAKLIEKMADMEKNVNRQAGNMDTMMTMMRTMSDAVGALKGSPSGDVFPAASVAQMTGSSPVSSPRPVRVKRITSQTTPEGDLPKYLGFKKESVTALEKDSSIPAVHVWQREMKLEADRCALTSATERQRMAAVLGTISNEVKIFIRPTIELELDDMHARHSWQEVISEVVRYYETTVLLYTADAGDVEHSVTR